ncbi:hypothetical protein [Flavobacterium sp. N1736]|uniref:hypothetical protein n=1 Tax=Flavobacterium sp. N1736 TaxID=2986823 RepID=UPI00222476D0|nr:hypothetical protein [Flavobacterium sp. N1736]
MNQNKTIIQDTIIQKTVIIKDTIYASVQKLTENSTDVEIYKKILENQSQTYTLILGGFVGVLALFATGTYLYQTRIAKTDIEKQTNKIFKREKERLADNVKKEINQELYKMKGESARLFANQCTNTTPATRVQLFYWCCQCIKYYGLCENGGSAVRASCRRAIRAAEYLNNNKLTCKPVLLNKHPDLNKKFYSIFDKIPKELTEEKEKLVELLNDIVS